ncbi:MAG TPA: hypothetical protein VFZ18_13270 [Longimicrobiaceae bacterium]
MFLRRDRRSRRFVNWQVGLFFLAAGIWLGGVVAGRPGVTPVAIAVAVVAVLLGAAGRRGGEE